MTELALTLAIIALALFSIAVAWFVWRESDAVRGINVIHQRMGWMQDALNRNKHNPEDLAFAVRVRAAREAIWRARALGFSPKRHPTRMWIVLHPRTPVSIVNALSAEARLVYVLLYEEGLREGISDTPLNSEPS